MSASPRLVIFDWDGTLADAAGRVVRACVEALSEHGWTVPARSLILAHVGIGVEHAFRHLMPGASEREVNRVARRFRELWALGGAQPDRLLDGARECLERLSGDGVLLAVATGKSRRGLDSELAHHGLSPLFAATRSADDAPPKPAPEMLLAILSELDVAPHTALMVGDTSYDMAMARAAGIPRLGVRSGVHDERLLLPFAPLGVLDGVSALVPWLSARWAASAVDLGRESGQ